MRNDLWSKAEGKFTKVQEQERKALKERDKERQAANEQIARLKALRLAKEAADREVAAQAAAAKAAAKGRRSSK